MRIDTDWNVGRARLKSAAPRFLMRLFAVDRIIRELKPEIGAAAELGEVGAGLGDFAEYALTNPAVRSLVLYDGSQAACASLNARFNGNEKVTVCQSFSADKPSFDLLFCFEVIEHQKDDLVLISELANAIRPGGWLIGSVPAYQAKWQTVDELAGHYRRYEMDQLRNKLESVGMTVRRIDVYGFPVTNLLYPFRELHSRLKLARQASPRSKAEATAKSGVSRGLVGAWNQAMIFWVVKLLSGFQLRKSLQQWGDGFVFFAKKE